MPKPKWITMQQLIGIGFCIAIAIMICDLQLRHQYTLLSSKKYPLRLALRSSLSKRFCNTFLRCSPRLSASVAIDMHCTCGVQLVAQPYVLDANGHPE